MQILALNVMIDLIHLRGWSESRKMMWHYDHLHLHNRSRMCSVIYAHTHTHMHTHTHTHTHTYTHIYTHKHTLAYNTVIGYDIYLSECTRMPVLHYMCNITDERESGSVYSNWSSHVLLYVLPMQKPKTRLDRGGARIT